MKLNKANFIVFISTSLTKFLNTPTIKKLLITQEFYHSCYDKWIYRGNCTRKISLFLGYGAESLTDGCPSFRPLTIRPLYCLLTSGTHLAVERCNIPEERRPHWLSCESLNSRTVWETSLLSAALWWCKASMANTFSDIFSVTVLWM
jgi:hypothetical protein